jgi:hypothetical protein
MWLLIWALGIAPNHNVLFQVEDASTHFLVVSALKLSSLLGLEGVHAQMERAFWLSDRLMKMALTIGVTQLSGSNLFQRGRSERSIALFDWSAF